MEQCVFNKWEASNRCELCIIQRSLSLREREHGVRNTGWDQYVCLCDNITSPEKVRRDKRNREELKERRTPAGGASRESKKERIRQHEDQTWINYNNMNPTKNLLTKKDRNVSSNCSQTIYVHGTSFLLIGCPTQTEGVRNWWVGLVYSCALYCLRWPYWECTCSHTNFIMWIFVLYAHPPISSVITTKKYNKQVPLIKRVSVTEHKFSTFTEVNTSAC